MRIIFIGTVEFSLHTLQKLIDLNVNLVGVCTKDSSTFNSDYADLRPVCISNSIPYLCIDDINSKESISWINNMHPDIIFCFGWSSIIHKEILSIPPLGIVGYHPTRLPENRGRHPLIWALVMGLEKSASTFFFMSEGIDDGEILSQVDFPILYEDDAQSLYDKVTGVALEQIENFVPKLKNNDYRLISQNHNTSNYLRKRNQDDGLIDFRMSSRAIYNLVRGLTKPYIGAHIYYRGENISIWKVKELENVQKNIEPGKVLKIYDTSIVIKCFDKSIEIIEHDFKTLPKVGEYLCIEY